MKLIYLTAKEYPGGTADHIYIREMARAFYSLMGNDFLFVTAKNVSKEISEFPNLSANIKWSHGKSFFYFFWLPYFILRSKNWTRDTVFFSNDPNLLVLLIFWKRMFRFKNKICSDWHMLFGDWRDSFIVDGSDYLITTSEKLKKSIVAISKNKGKKVLVVYGGVNLEKYESLNKSDARNKLNLPKDKKIVAYVGFFKTMGMEKGIKTMIEALPELPSEVIMLFVGGKDDEIWEYKKFAENKGVSDRCIFIGRKPQDELFLYETASDVLSIPYPDQPHFRNFGFPMKVYEYMANRRPIIYSKLELVEE
ncbi:MAG: glycosyltransferase, partial [Patescibacteria group bacterium]